MKPETTSAEIHESAFIAPNVGIYGSVKIGKNVRIMHGAQIIAENSTVIIGDNCIILENAVVRATENHPVSVGNYCLIGPNAHIAGCTINDEVFIATGASVFHGAFVNKGAEVRINAVVHIKTTIPENETVPIGWIAVGNPVKMFPPDKHNEIWEIQKTLNFPEYVYNIDRSKGDVMKQICNTMSERLGRLKID